MKILRLVFLILLLLPLINADLISLNSGGSEKIAMTPGGDIENFFVRLSGGGPYQVVLECPDSTARGSSMGCIVYVEDEGTVAVESTCVTWIDLNNDGDKDTNEAETSFSKLTTPGDNITQSISLHIPGSTPLGFQIIRTVCSYANSPHPNSTSSDAVTIIETVVVSPGGGPSAPSVGEEVVEEEEIEEGIPAQLFDIKFELEENIIYSSDELSAVVTFENFGTEKTLVELMFIILDDEGNRVYEEGEDIIIETEGLLRKSFEDLDLDYGKYVIVMETLYGDDVFDEFRQDFEIERKEVVTCLRFNWISYLLLLIIFVLLLWIIILKNQLRKAREKRAGVWGKGIDVLGKGVALIRRWAIRMLERVIRLIRKKLIKLLGGRIKPLK
jgi:hypothetical protein